MNSPYYLLRGGGISSDSLSSAGSGGSYWSSTPITSEGAYDFGFVLGSVNTGPISRAYGYSVRCVAAS